MPIPSMSAAADVVGSQKLEAQPNRPFFLYHYPGEPGDWELGAEGLSKPTWLPTLRSFHLEPGVSNVRTLEKGEDPMSAYDAAILALQRKGAVVYLPDSKAMQISDSAHLPDDVEPGAYIRATPTTHGGPYYHLAHDVLDNPRRPGQRHRQQHNEASYNRWLVHLMETGTIEAPAADIVEERIMRQEAKVRSAQVDTKANASVRDAAVSTQSARLAAMRAAVVVKPSVKRGK